MQMKTIALTMGLGAAAGAVAIMMVPRQSPARRLVAKAADKVEQAAWMVSDKMMDQFDM